jgi:CelD/BcsL family acetyltransferase involved in cellulose biosynthesis
MHDFGTPPHPISFFKILLEHFSQDAYVGVAKIDHRIIAASFGIYSGKNVYHLFACIDDKFKNTNAGDLLIFHEMINGSKLGLEQFWLGRSRRNSGVEFYKSKWNPIFTGTVEKNLLQEKNSKAINQDTKRDLTSKVFKKMPSNLFIGIGTRCRRFIP